MKTVITAIAAAFLAATFTFSADAAGTKKSGMHSNASASKAATCKAEAKKKFSALHPLKRRSFEKKCMGTA